MYFKDIYQIVRSFFEILYKFRNTLLADPRRIRRRGVAKEGMAIAAQGLGVLVLPGGEGSVLGRAA